jgi:hypothetical protein
MSAPPPIILGLTLFALVVWVFAFWRGGAAERWGAAIILGNQVLALILSYVVGLTIGARGLVAQLALDGVTAAALLLVLLKFGRPWLGAAMLLYAAQFALHSVYFVGELKKDRLHAVLNNLNFLAIHLSLAVGTVQNWWHLRKSART